MKKLSLIKGNVYSTVILVNFSFSRTGDVSMRRLKLWEESFEELLCDEIGRETLQKFSDKEYSGENLRFWWQVNYRF